VSVEYCLNVAAYPQPSPARNPAGDCFACALTAALRYLLPEPPTFDQCWDAFVHERHSRPTNTWTGLQHAAKRIAGRELEVLTDILRPKFDSDMWEHAWWSYMPERDWVYRLEGWLRMGFVATTAIAQNGGGPLLTDGLNTTDHFVLLDGVRYGWKYTDTPHGGVGSVEYDVHVVCSVRGPYWIRARDLLIQHGAAALMLIRRDAR
jgi:hypothetical protein